MMGNNPSKFKQGDKYPVEQVSWDDIQAYIRKLNAKTGKRYRLPTEAEWEYAARAGTTTVYWWGNSLGNNRANCDGCGSRWDAKSTAPAGSFSPNPWGLYDTVGNVWEWTCSEYKSYGGEERRCASKISGAFRSSRGGYWNAVSWRVRSSARESFWPSARSSSLGFRLAQDL